MLCALPSDQYRVFSGVAPLAPGFRPHTALVHADAGTPDLAELIAEMADRTATGYLFGGLASSRSDVVQFAVGGNGNLKGHGKAGGVFRGGLSGVAFGEGVQLVSRITQGCQPISAARTITGADGNLVTELDGEPALDVLLDDVGIDLEEPHAAMATLRATLVGLTQASEDVVNRTGHFGTDVVVRHIIGLDPRRRGVAIASKVEEGMRLAFCRRDVEAARADLVRICAEIREELEPEELTLAAATARAAPDALAPPSPATSPIAGAVYVSCAGRGGPHFGGPSAELQIVRRALGDVPLVGFFAGGEIGRSHLYGYTGVLTVFR
jgi:small ligand-binding sensory domain FIST